MGRPNGKNIRCNAKDMLDFIKSDWESYNGDDCPPTIMRDEAYLWHYFILHDDLETQRHLIHHFRKQLIFCWEIVKKEIPIKRNADFFAWRHGFYSREDMMTLKEVGDIFGVTQERVRQSCAKTRRMLKHPARSSIIKNFFYERDIDNFLLKQKKIKSTWERDWLKSIKEVF